MRTYQIIHRLAILSLLVVAVMSTYSAMHQVLGAPLEMRLSPLYGLGIWFLLLWKIWKRPRKWGIGVGIFLLLTIPFQSYLWWLAVNNPKLNTLAINHSVADFILLYELPILIAGLSCVLLWFFYPNEDSTAKDAQPSVAANGD